MRFRALLLAALLLAAREASADPAAEALFRAGRDAAAGGDWQTACARFEESLRIEPAVGTVFNLANCREQLGQVATAWQRFREAKDRLPQGDERIAVTEQRLAALEPRLPKLTLVRGSSAAQGTVKRDGVELGDGSFGLALPVDPGKHLIVVQVPGRAERRYEVELAEGEHERLVVESGALEAPAGGEPGAPALPPEASSSTSPARTWGFVLGGVGLAGIAVGAVTGAMVLGKKSDVERECDGKLCTAEGVEAGEDGRLYSTISTVAFAVGVAGVAAGATLILTASDGKETARVQVRALPGAAALSLGGRF